MKINYRLVSISVLLFAFSACMARGQQQSPSPAQSLSRHFDAINKKLLDMAQDFPADKYDFRPTKETRSFGEVLVHTLSGNVYAAKAGRGDQANWDELNPKDYKNKDEIVAALKKSITDADATLKSAGEERLHKTLQPWIDVLEHSAEHYGQLVVYYRLNGLTPPESRPQPK